MPVWQCVGKTLDLGEPLIMGILNVTPDSFSDGGVWCTPQAAIAHARAMAAEGAAIIDVGGESTRPGAQPVSEQQELDRVVPVVARLAAEGLVVSVDTSRPSVMRACAQAGASILNDVRGFELPGAFEAACETSLGLCIMHMRGTPATMDRLTDYASVVDQVRGYLASRAQAFRARGVCAQRICLDPGFGFAKDVRQNWQLLRGLGAICALGYPVLAGLSRKRCVGEVVHVQDPAGRDPGSLAAALLAVQQGARVLRVHNVRATAQGLAVLRAFNQGADQ